MFQRLDKCHNKEYIILDSPFFHLKIHMVMRTNSFVSRLYKQGYGELSLPIKRKPIR